MSVEISEAIALHGDEEVADVLATLNQLVARVGSPLLRTCLESTAEEILHLTGCGDEPESLEAGFADD